MNIPKSGLVILIVVGLMFTSVANASQYTTREEIRACSDVDISFDGTAEVSRSEEKLSIPMTSSVLTITPSRDGGVTVFGGTENDYSIIVCKAAPGTSAEGQSLLRQIRPTTQRNELSVEGPSGQQWEAFFIIQAPKGAELDVRSDNGPVELREVTGKFAVDVRNGPVAIARSAGEFDIEARNGPINFAGNTGTIRLNAENGPIIVVLSGASWKDGSLQARAKNGPLSLKVGDTFRSGVVVESDGDSPMSCNARICSEARKTWNDHLRRIEIGSGPVVVRMSAKDGPVDVSGTSGD
jgi:hypothetical protein